MPKKVIFGVVLIVCAGLAGCGKNSSNSHSTSSDQCSDVTASPYQTQEQAVEECRNRHKMSDEPDPKPSNTLITNH